MDLAKRKSMCIGQLLVLFPSYLVYETARSRLLETGLGDIAQVPVELVVKLNKPKITRCKSVEMSDQGKTRLLTFDTGLRVSLRLELRTFRVI